MIVEIPTDSLATLQGLSDLHLERRRRYITASDMPAVVGVDSYRNRGDVYLDKIGADVPAWNGSVPAAIGICAESALRRMTEHVLGVKLTRSGAWNVKGVMGATLDDVVENDRTHIVQYKTTGSKLSLDEGPPPNHIIQVHSEMICSEAAVAYIAYLKGDFGPLQFRIFKVELDEVLANSLRLAAERFWHGHVVPRTPPDEAPSLDVVNRLKRLPKKSVRVPDSLISEYARIRDSRLTAERAVKQLKEVEDKALAAIVSTDLEAEQFESGIGTLTYFSQTRKAFTSPAVTYPVPRLKLAK